MRGTAAAAHPPEDTSALPVPDDPLWGPAGQTGFPANGSLPASHAVHRRGRRDTRMIEPVPRNVGNIDTPALIVDLDVFERNLQRMAAFFRGRRAQLRPHSKSHK